MFFSSIKEINVFSNIKNKRISNIYLKVTIEKEGHSEDLKCSKCKKIVSRPFFGATHAYIIEF